MNERGDCFICIIVKKRPLLFKWNDEQKTFDDVEIPLQLPETPKAVVWKKDSLYININTEYQQLRMNGDVHKLFHLGSKNNIAKINSLTDGCIAFGHDNKSVLYDCVKNRVRQSVIVWSGFPVVVEEDAPYLIAAMSKFVEIRPYMPPSDSVDCMQKIELENIKYTAKASSGRIYVASANSIWCLKAKPAAHQIEGLIKRGQFELAKSVATLMVTATAEREEIEKRIQQLYSFHLFMEGQFKKALDLFWELKTDPTQVIGLYPNMLSDDSNIVLQYPQTPPKLKGVVLDKALKALSDYLTNWRHKLDSILRSSSSDAISARDLQRYEMIYEIVDTTLIKCYLQTNPMLVSNLLRLPNKCNFEQTEKALKKEKKYEDLVILYQNRGKHKQALAFFKR